MIFTHRKVADSLRTCSQWANPATSRRVADWDENGTDMRCVRISRSLRRSPSVELEIMWPLSASPGSTRAVAQCRWSRCPCRLGDKPRKNLSSLSWPLTMDQWQRNTTLQRANDVINITTTQPKQFWVYFAAREMFSAGFSRFTGHWACNCTQLEWFCRQHVNVKNVSGGFWPPCGLGWSVTLILLQHRSQTNRIWSRSRSWSWSCSTGLGDGFVTSGFGVQKFQGASGSGRKIQ